MIGVGIIGAGYWAEIHMAALKQISDARLAATCRNDQEGLDAFCARHGGKPYLDYRALLDDAEVDAVLIAAPHHLHEEMAVAAAQAGKHILLEKPMAPTLAACDRIIAAAENARVSMLVGHTMRFALPCLAARKIIEDRTYGEARFGASWLVKLWMEENRRPWHLTTETGGGMLLTAGIHALDRLMFLMGRPVVGVSAVIETALHDQAADDSAMLLLRFASSGAGQVASIGYRQGAGGFAAEIVCEDAILRIDFDNGVSIGRDGKWAIVPNSIDPDWHIAATRREWEALIAAIACRAPLHFTAKDARSVIACIEAAFRSSCDCATMVMPL